jgi:excisionase family DNA binding protein
LRVSKDATEFASMGACLRFGPPSTPTEEGRMAKTKSKTVNLKDAAPVKGEPVRMITLDEAAERLGVSKPTILKYERLGKLPRAREICGCTRFIEHEFEAAVTSSPFRKLRGLE